MDKLFIVNTLRWYVRLPLKWAIFGFTVLIVCFPYPGRLVAHIAHWRDPNALIEPDAPALRPLVEELRRTMSDDLAPKDVLRHVERFVIEKLPYEWDWNTWGTADYLPTVTEAMEMGKEDCDGRAVIAASLLRNLGFETQIVTDFAHVWVKTDKGETMGPGKKKAVVATEHGLRISRDALGEVPKAMAYGLAAFPAGRELIIFAVLWLLLLRRHGGVWCGLAGLACLVGGLFLLRAGSATYLQPTAWMQWAGVTGWLAGLAVLLFLGARNAKARCPVEPGGTGAE